MAISDRQLMLAGMKPSLEPGDYVFCTSNPKDDAVWLDLRPLGMFRETEGTTLILENTVARSHGLVASAPMRKITLGVYSALEGVGLTAAISTALAEAGIACNVVAGFHHDHVFVPSEKGDRALAVLQKVQSEAMTSTTGDRP